MQAYSDQYTPELKCTYRYAALMDRQWQIQAEVSLHPKAVRVALASWPDIRKLSTADAKQHRRVHWCS